MFAVERGSKRDLRGKGSKKLKITASYTEAVSPSLREGSGLKLCWSVSSRFVGLPFLTGGEWIETSRPLLDPLYRPRLPFLTGGEWIETSGDDDYVLYLVEVSPS